MNYLKIIIKNLIYYRKSNLLFLISTVITSSIIIGSLIVGDSVRTSLEKTAINNLGKTDYILTGGSRYFNDSISKSLADHFDIETSSIINLKGSCIKDGGKYKLNDINVIGIDKKFFNFSNNQKNMSLKDNEIFINRKLAGKINLKEKDELVVRIKKINLMPEEAPLAKTSNDFVSFNLVVKRILDADSLGDFNIRISQIPQANLFISKELLSKKMDLNNLCNLVLITGNNKNNITIDKLNTELKDLIKLEDAGLKIREIKSANQIELISDRIFMDDNVERLLDNKNIKIMTYFVNEINFNHRSTPYSFVTSRDDLKINNDEIIINRWLSEDLNVKLNDFITLKYFVFGTKNELKEESKIFKVIKIIDDKDKLIDQFMMPEYPGFSNITNCRDWDPDIYIDISRIRNKDEQYWNEFKGTPKAIISFNTASRIWNNRFGNITAVRFYKDYYNEKMLRKEIEGKINPQVFNLKFVSIKKQAMNATRDSIDFGQLFIGLSSFMIIALLIFTIMLYGFNLEKRRNQIGVLSSLGFKFIPIFFINFLEALILVIISFIIGIVFAVLYVRLILLGLTTVWNNALSTSSLYVYINQKTLAAGFIVLLVLMIPSIIMQILHYLKYPIKSIRNIYSNTVIKINNKKNAFSFVFMIIVFSLTIISFIMIFVLPEEHRISFFFISSFLTLMSFLILFNRFMMSIKYFNNNIIFFALRNLSKNKKRNLSIMGLLATGLFIIFITGINTKSLEHSFNDRKSGTGGFNLYAELTNPVIKDINKIKIDPENIDIKNINFVQIRLKQYDDASCLNMNHITNPSIIGINPEDFDKRNCFSIIQTIDHSNNKKWSLLNMKYDDSIIPAIIDSKVLKWGLNKKLGDTITYTNDHGNDIKIILAAVIDDSIFQGKIIISEDNFIKNFPSINGYNIFLVDEIKSNQEEIKNIIVEKFRNYGIEIKNTDLLLNEFNKVENTYLSIFFILGCFGLILGTIGMGMVIIKNIYEDKNQTAILTALGFERKKIFLLYFIQHMVLFLIGIFIGLFSSLVVVIPMMLIYGLKINVLSMLGVILIIIIAGFISIYFAVKISLNQKIITNLKND